MMTSEILNRLNGVKKRGGGWTAHCPAHEDRTPSLSVSAGAKGVVLHCHAGCLPQDVAKALGLQMRDLFYQQGNGGRPDIVATYDYVDEDGTLLFQVTRLVPKGFRQRKPDGRGGWEWRLGDTRRVLYRLPTILEAISLGKLLAVVEGEKDADRLVEVGVAATTNPGGAGKWRREYTETLRDAAVVILPDNDAPGRKHAEEVAAALHGVATDVRVLELPNLPDKGDVSDWLDAGGAADELRRLARSASTWAGPRAVEKRRADSGPDVETGEGAGEDSPTLTDTGNASRLVAVHGDRLHYIAPWRKWLVFDPDRGVWIRDHADVRVRELAKDVGSALKAAATTLPDEDRSKKTLSFAFKSLNAHGISGMVDLARGIEGIPLDYDELDRNGWLLGVENGVVDLQTGELRDADPADLLTMKCPVSWDQDASAERWEQATAEWFPDPEVRAYVKRVAGSALVGAQQDHVFIVHYGVGRNGKGTFTRAIRRVLGPYAVVIHLALLVEQKYSQHDTVKAELFRARLAVASETQRGVRLDEASVKNLTGGDRITARRMREDPWEFDPTHSLWLQTNHLPEIGGRDRGIWSRIRVVKWESTFEGGDQDQDLDETLIAEAAGILRWLVEGCLEWQEHGLAEPEAVIRATLVYRESEDVFSRFASDTGLVFDPRLEIQAGRLQDLLSEWAQEEGTDPPRRDVGDWLRENGARKKQRRVTGADGKTKRPKFWVGIGFLDEKHLTAHTDDVA